MVDRKINGARSCVEWGGWIPNHLVASVCLLSAPILLSSWKLWDTLLELITVEWGKRWGETAEITFLLSLLLLSGLFGWTTVPAFCDGVAGWRWMGRNGGGGVTEVQLMHSHVTGEWWNNSLIQWKGVKVATPVDSGFINTKQYIFPVVALMVAAQSKNFIRF